MNKLLDWENKSLCGPTVSNRFSLLLLSPCCLLSRLAPGACSSGLSLSIRPVSSLAEQAINRFPPVPVVSQTLGSIASGVQWNPCEVGTGLCCYLVLFVKSLVWVFLGGLRCSGQSKRLFCRRLHRVEYCYVSRWRVNGGVNELSNAPECQERSGLTDGVPANLFQHIPEF